MAKLNTNSNAYTIIYASVMVIIVAFLLAFVASSLKETQDANVLRDKKGQILSSVNLRNLSDDEKDAKYTEVITENEDGTYIANVDGQNKLIVRLDGAGLWGPIWGYVAINPDKTVYGTFFNHEGETAGLGALIKEEPFQKQFEGKKVFNEAGEVALSVYKKDKAPASVSADNYVDAVTGATLTSNGVNDMIQKCLKEKVEVINSFN